MKFFISTLLAISVCCEVAVCNPTAKSTTGETQSNKALLKKIENYLHKSCNSFSARFVEKHGLYGPVVKGVIYLKRSAGKMKMRYDDSQVGDPLTVVVQDFHVTIYNRDLNEKTVMPVTASPLGFLLQKELKLNERLRVVSITRQNNTIAVELAKKSDDSEGTITLVFSEQPFELTGWIIFEKNGSSRGRRVEIVLENPNTKAKIDNKVFETFS